MSVAHTSHFPLRFPISLAPSSLAFALDGAAQIITAVRMGMALPAALAALTPRISLPAARGAIQDIASCTLRVLGCARAIVASLSRGPSAEHIESMLMCACALLIDTPDGAVYTPFTVVDQAVYAVGARREYFHAKGKVNAVLRHFLRTQSACLARVRQDPVARWNYPNWWIRAVHAAWPQDWQRILAAGDRQAPMTLRVNLRHMNAQTYVDKLKAASIAAQILSPNAVRLMRPMPVEKLPGFEAGWVSVQDEGAQRAATLLNVESGMRVLDACAAPGGKTGHLLELADLELIALEKKPQRTVHIHENLKRLGLQASVCTGDANTPQNWWDGRPFDRILADVPCTGSGIVRRHPDIRWLKREEDITLLQAEQRRILTALWPLLKPGGELLYVTCSIFPGEGQEQAAWFSQRHKHDAQSLPAPGQLLPSVKLEDVGTGMPVDHDGFFYARFRKLV
jgi:16S rRNA (cytosine967-C5)-methyltransferase